MSTEFDRDLQRCRDELDAYRLGRLGHEEYSILSVLEEINQEREHAEQIRAIVSLSTDAETD